MKKKVDISAWEIYRAIKQKYGATRFTDELYQWFVARYRTISYGTAGTFTLLTLPEKDAIEVMTHAYHRLENLTEISWPDWLKINNHWVATNPFDEKDD